MAPASSLEDGSVSSVANPVCVLYSFCSLPACLRACLPFPHFFYPLARVPAFVEPQSMVGVSPRVSALTHLCRITCHILCLISPPGRRIHHHSHRLSYRSQKKRQCPGD
ncbi:hypothetical protein BJV74DRAFT_859863 [Russula compacta]|nr:hypothetical protein BJV74DRAFT_859863 [Russula compacta]